MEPLVKWKEVGDEWRLYVGRGSRKPYQVATVWPNGTWHTWDSDGWGGENSQEPTVKQAKVEAAASAIAQGFI